MVSLKSALSVVLLAGTTSISSAFTVAPIYHATGKTTTPSSLFMGWGPDPIWSGSEVESTQMGNMSKESVVVNLAIPPETAQDFTIPGQYVQLRPNEETKPIFLAIASPPDAENARFEFLVKKTDDNTWLTDGSASTLEISQVLGGGFPVKEELDSLKYDFPCQNILLFAAGSGISPIRSAIESGELQTTGARTARLYYGARNEDDLCYVDRFPLWEKNGVEVVPVLSQPSENWQGRTGYVQNALEEDGVPVPRNTGALMCGMKGMTEAVTDILTKAGTFEGRVLTNF
mmetsp:Transcript_16479/g.45433  ORF Transcript_16479/g.45433 Transcript_16479/m.45433 type:complete len:288 (+) Transcript_16479:28-891(+)